MSIVGERIKFLRKINNKTQCEIGEIIGVGATAISNYENDNTTPSTQKIVKLAKYFDVDVDYIIGRKNSMREPNDEYAVLSKIPLVDETMVMQMPTFIAAVAKEYIITSTKGSNNTFAVNMTILGTQTIVVAERGNDDTKLVLCKVGEKLEVRKRHAIKSKSVRPIGGILSFE